MRVHYKVYNVHAYLYSQTAGHVLSGARPVPRDWPESDGSGRAPHPGGALAELLLLLRHGHERSVISIGRTRITVV